MVNGIWEQEEKATRLSFIITNGAVTGIQPRPSLVRNSGHLGFPVFDILAYANALSAARSAMSALSVVDIVLIDVSGWIILTHMD